MRFPISAPAAALATALIATAWPAAAEEAGRSNIPLEIYCNTAPEFGVQRSDAVDNWVRVCTVWLNAKCAASSPSAEEILKKQAEQKNR